MRAGTEPSLGHLSRRRSDAEEASAPRSRLESGTHAADTSRRPLSITHDFSPNPSAGTQSCWKIARCLPQHGWTPVVLAGQGPGLSTDGSSSGAHLGIPVLRPPSLPHSLGAYKLLRSLIPTTCAVRSVDNGPPASDRHESASLRKHILSLLMLPDACTGWLAPALVASLVAARRLRVGHVLSSGPCWSNHLVGLLLARLTRLPWTVHFRDPWMQVPAWKPTDAGSRGIEPALECAVLTPVGAVVCVTERHTAAVRRQWVVRRHRASLLHSHFGTCGAAMLPVKRETGLRMITTFYGADVSQVPLDPEWRQRYACLFTKGDLFLAEGNAMRRALEDLGCPAEKIVVQRLGVDLEAIPFVAREPGPSGEVRVLIAGIFREKKGIPDALRAVDRVRRRHPRLRVTLVGDGGGKPADEDEKRVILDLLARLDGVVAWVGFLPYPEYRAALLTHHLFLSPSVTALDGDSEGGAPVSIIEAEATGIPIVSTVHADIPEIVLDGESGLLSPERDIDALAENLERLVADPNLRRSMGKAGRAHVEEHHDVRKQAVRLETIYAGVLEGRLP